MKKVAFTLTEVLVAITIMSIMAGVMALTSATVGQQTAKREAERVAAFIQGHISRENIAQRGLWFEIKTDSIEVWHGLKGNTNAVPKLNANQGCSYGPSTAKLCYNIRENILLKGDMSLWKLISADSTVVTEEGTNGQHYIRVQGADNKFLNVIIGRRL